MADDILSDGELDALLAGMKEGPKLLAAPSGERTCECRGSDIRPDRDYDMPCALRMSSA